MIPTCVSHGEQVAVGGLGLVDDRDVNDGCEDGTIERSAEGGEFEGDVLEKDGSNNKTRQSGLMYLATLTAAVTMELCDMVATRLIPQPSAPRSYTYNSQAAREFTAGMFQSRVLLTGRLVNDQ